MNLLYCPLALPVKFNQFFGENKACVDIETGTKVITADGNNPPPGYRSVYGPAGHLGLDMAAYHGQEVYAARDGVVYDVDTETRTGLDIRVVCDINGRKIRYIFEHLLGYQGKIGDIVKTGQLLGWADNTGYSSADHLHYQTEELINGVWTPINPLLVTDMTICAKDILYYNDKLAWIREQIALISDRFASYLRNKGR